MHELASVLLNQFSIQTGTIAGFESEGSILVTSATLDTPVPAHFLRTSAAPPPVLRIGDPVLFALDADEARAFVLGGIAAYNPHDESRDVQASEIDDAEREDMRRGPVEISMPRHASDSMRLKGNRIYIEAGEEIQLKCGGGTILIDKRGKIVVRGTDVVSRARRTNKIKGASVAIN